MSYVYVAATVLLTVYGQLVVKWQVGDAARLADPSQRTAFLLGLLANPWVLSAFAAAFAAALCWMLAMVKLELSHAYPFISLSFVLVLFLAFGLSFELPVALVILALLGWVTPAQLREGRGYAVVGIFIVAAILTPPDVVSQLMLAIPMCLLYEAGILAASMVAPRASADGVDAG